ncbi:PREDICTED: protein AUXIN-REGULATED GENE INVOLVED IN ORGAN SIZE-like [Camelina sativa]|uniref:Protein AUXIN-REGULATED GENE INVOLVED IN ORGAN SIZE-like n=1 Tax=Camelina sativa TaxID=90675 RepID=A0ABM0Z9C4_CAMSA|nr:PREDICTED: protein AUXIN-REGULATED GENE INVOLVED IN ORGAN SIZE-like [Camelina sativa]
MIRDISNLQNDIRNMKERCSNNLAMDVGRNNNRRQNVTFRSSPAEKSKQELRRSFSSQKRLMILPASYFSLESLFLLVCLTASLLILPLVLPPLPPPPFMLLLVPIGIMVLLVVLAFMPSSHSNANPNTHRGDVTCHFM